MSKISDLAKTFQQNSQQELKDIEQQAKSDIHELRKSINAELKQSEQKIIADIRAQQMKMSKAIFSPYLWSLGGLLLIAALLLGVNFYLAKQIANQRVEYQEAKAATEKLDQYSKKIQLSTCTTKDKQGVLCVAIQPNSPIGATTGNTEPYCHAPANKRA